MHTEYVYMCMYMYKCMYIYIYVCMYVYMYLYTNDIECSPAELICTNFKSNLLSFTNGTIGALRFISFCMIRL